MTATTPLLPLVISLLVAPVWADESPIPSAPEQARSVVAPPEYIERQNAYLDAVRAQREALVEQHRNMAESMRPGLPSWVENDRHAREMAIQQQRDDMERLHEVRRSAIQGWMGGPWSPGFGPTMIDRAQIDEMHEERIKAFEQEHERHIEEMEYQRQERMDAMEKMREEHFTRSQAGYPGPYGPFPIAPGYPAPY